MMKQNKGKLVITSLIILLPMLAGCLLWNQLPDKIATHFGADNQANGWSSKSFTVFVMPLILLFFHILCLAVTSVDPKVKNIGKKPLEIIFWIIPGISLLVFVMIYANALHTKINIGFVCCLLLGFLFVVLENLLPKAKQNFTFGIKLPWTLDNPENWNQTHRVAGWCMVAAGLVLIIASFWHPFWLLLTVAVLVVAIPTVYSYLYYRRTKY